MYGWIISRKTAEGSRARSEEFIYMGRLEPVVVYQRGKATVWEKESDAQAARNRMPDAMTWQVEPL